MDIVPAVETAITLDRDFDLRIVPIFQVKQLSLFGFPS